MPRTIRLSEAQRSGIFQTICTICSKNVNTDGSLLKSVQTISKGEMRTISQEIKRLKEAAPDYRTITNILEGGEVFISKVELLVKSLGLNVSMLDNVQDTSEPMSVGKKPWRTPEVDAKEIAQWSFEDFDNKLDGVVEGFPFSALYPRSCKASELSLIKSVQEAQERIITFGLTRNFFVDQRMLPVLVEAAKRIPVRIFLMNPAAKSRDDRYRLEPLESAMSDSARVYKLLLYPLLEASIEVERMKQKNEAGFFVYLFDFPVAFALEAIDSEMRVMLYGMMKRGTDSPMMVFHAGTPYYDYFNDQIAWLENSATRGMQTKDKTAKINFDLLTKSTLMQKIDGSFMQRTEKESLKKLVHEL